MSIIFKAIYKFNIFPIKILTFWGKEKFEKLILTILMKIQDKRSMGPKPAKTTIKSKGKTYSTGS